MNNNNNNNNNNKYVSVTTVRKAIEGARKDIKRAEEHLDKIEKLLLILYDKHSPHKQTCLTDDNKPSYVSQIETWLIDHRKLTSMPEFNEFVKAKGVDTIRRLCYNLTYHKLDMITINDIARGCLTPAVEVIKNE